MILIVKTVCAKCGLPSNNKIITEELKDCMISVTCDRCSFFKFELYEKQSSSWKPSYEIAVIMNKYLPKEKHVDLTQYTEHKSTDTTQKESTK